jgi:hypothetical protein
MDESCPYFPIPLRMTKTPAVRARTLDRRGFYATVPHLPPRKLGPKPTRLIIVLASVGAMLSVAAAAEKFQKLSGSQIRAKLAAMEITDEVHWADVYGAGGTLTTFSDHRQMVGQARRALSRPRQGVPGLLSGLGFRQEGRAAARRLEPAARRRAAAACEAQVTERPRSPRMRVQEPCSIWCRSLP